MGKKIVMTSGKGGVGKTTVTANLGIALSMLSKKVALVDADIGLNNLDVVMLIENKIVYDIGDIAEGRCRTKQALIQDDAFPSLFTLPSAKTMSSRIPPRVFVSIANELAEGFDYVLIDCPAGIDEGFHRAVVGADEALVVTTPHISAVRDADKVVALLSTYDMNSIGLVVNRLKGNLVSEGISMDALDIAKLLRVPLKGAIPEDERINVSSQINKIKDKSSAQLAYTLLASYVDGKDTKVFDCASDYRGFFKKLLKVFR